MKFHFPKIEPAPGVTLPEWNSWTWQFKNGLATEADFAKYFDLSEPERTALRELKDVFQIRTTPYYARIRAIRKLLMPSLLEKSSGGQQLADPLGEKHHSPADRLIHRYPDRVLFLVTDQCSVYCRYCTRKHFTGQDQAFVGSESYQKALEYLKSAKGVREVILSGGDPLTLSDGRLRKVLSDIRAIEHIEIIRIGSRMPVVCPMRITPELAQLLKEFKPVFLMTHFVHPKELTAEAAIALELLVDNGVPVFNQMVLLNGINNHPAIVQALSRRLLYLRVKPYYMFQCDPSEGSDHFRTSVEESLEIQRELWGRLSGLAMPNLSLDIPGGGGKVGLVPEFEVSRSESGRTYKGWDGVEAEYKSPALELRELPGDVGDYLSEWEELKGQEYGEALDPDLGNG